MRYLGQAKYQDGERNGEQGKGSGLWGRLLASLGITEDGLE